MPYRNFVLNIDILGGFSSSQTLNHLLGIIEIPSPVGLCTYCAAHLDGLTDAFMPSSSSNFQKLSQSGLPLGKIAGNPYNFPLIGTFILCHLFS